ncbi:MAG: hypothetical protein LBU70_06600 [Chitinispirillales bacterium]|jgi:hypothetical protein|nr:hypothetical protein [Chitinispirillales bacterium]
MNIWRINLKPDAKKNVDSHQFCMENKIVGIGWPVANVLAPVSWKKYLEAAEEQYKGDGHKGWRKAINIMKNRMYKDDLIWTRDSKGIYSLGRIMSDWCYDGSNSYLDADIVNFRECEWYKIGTVDAIPGKIVNSFIPPATVQQVRSSAVMIFSQLIYNEKNKSNFYKVDKLSSKNIFDLLSPDDCEDVLAIYLQEKYNYYLIPSSCKKTTPAYEYTLINAKTNKCAIAQVRSGNESLNIDGYSKYDTRVYLFATSGNYLGQPKANITTVEPEEIRKFLYEYTHLLPKKMKVWVNMSR